jgi:uncharacterized membrane protein (UPF0127 family)
MDKPFSSFFRQEFFIILLLILPAIPSCGFHGRETPSTHEDIPFRTDGRLDFVGPDGSVLASIAVEIPQTPGDRVKGLMGRSLSGFAKGMLFIYERSEPRVFWMRNTPTSLDIIFVGGDRRVTSIARGTRAMSDQVYPSEGPAQYVIEVRSGFAKRFGIKEGTRIRWQ